MIIKSLTITETQTVYETYMKQDFPEEELKPFASIAGMMERGIYQVLGLYEGDTLCAYSMFVLSDKDSYCLLDYFAVRKEKRGTGIGHRYFDVMKEYFRNYFPKVKGVYIECETLRDVTDTTLHTERERRIAFYLDNGARKTSLASELFGVEYVILQMPMHSGVGNSREDATNAMLEQVDCIYQQMFQKKHYDTCVKLWIANE